MRIMASDLGIFYVEKVLQKRFINGLVSDCIKIDVDK